jgi:hypothetical protein
MENTIEIAEVEMERTEETVLAPNGNHHGNVATSFAWS